MSRKVDANARTVRFKGAPIKATSGRPRESAPVPEHLMLYGGLPRNRRVSVRVRPSRSVVAW